MRLRPGRPTSWPTRLPVHPAYTECCLTTVLGPASTLLLRQLGFELLTGGAQGQHRVNLEEIGRSLGVGAGTSPGSKLGRALARLGHFGYLKPFGGALPGYWVCTDVAPLSERQLDHGWSPGAPASRESSWQRRRLSDPVANHAGGRLLGQVVAHNLARARRLRCLSQADVAERLTRFTGAKWTQVAVSQAECSVSGQRVRQFTANELVALARPFDLPLLYFFTPPDDGRHGLAAPDSPPQGWSWPYLHMLVWGHRDNSAVVAERMAPWAHVLPMLTDVDDDDADREGPSPLC